MDWKDVMNMMTCVDIDEYEIEKNKKYIGRELFSMILPKNINASYLTKDNTQVIIKNSVLISGQIGNEFIGPKKTTSGIHLILDQYGIKEASKFINALVSKAVSFIDGNHKLHEIEAVFTCFHHPIKSSITLINDLENINKHFKSVCYECLGCLDNTNFSMLPCGHLICLECAKRNDICECFFCGNKFVWCSNADSFPSTSGARILSLDGGGVRGLIELYFLEYMCKHTNLSCRDLFDVCAGVSVGSILCSLILLHPFGNKKSLSDMILSFKEDLKKIFYCDHYFNGDFGKAVRYFFSGTTHFDSFVLKGKIEDMLEKVKGATFSELVKERLKCVTYNVDVKSHADEFHCNFGIGEIIPKLKTNE